MKEKNDQPNGGQPIYNKTLIEEKILQYLNTKDGWPAPPREIAQGIGENPNTVRARCSELHKKGNLERPFHGYYMINSTYGGLYSFDFRTPLLIQNLQVISNCVFPDGYVCDSSLIDFNGFGPKYIGAFHITLKLEGTGNIVWYLGASEGLDVQAIRILRLYLELILRNCGLPIDFDFNWKVLRCEVLRDLFGVDVSGLSSITLDDLESIMLKVYSKPYGLRVERRLKQPIDIDDLITVLFGPFPQFQLVKSISDQVNTLKQFHEAIKFTNSRLLSIERFIEKEMS